MNRDIYSLSPRGEALGSSNDTDTHTELMVDKTEKAVYGTMVNWMSTKNIFSLVACNDVYLAFFTTSSVALLSI